MRFYQINKKRIQEVFTLLSFSLLLISSFVPQLITAPQANAIVFSYPHLNFIKQQTEPIASNIEEQPVKSSSQDVVYPFIQESQSDFYYQADLGSFQTWFYDRAEKKAITRVGIDDQHYLEFFLPKEKNVPINLTEKGYSYQVSKDLKIDYSIKGNELKEDIIINQKPSDDSFEFSFKEKGIFHAEVGGEYYFFQSDSLEKIFKFQKPTVIDAEGQSGNISLNITDEKIVFTMDSEFRKNAQYPIVIDPYTVGTTTSTNGLGLEKDRSLVRNSRGIMIMVWYQNATNYLVGSRSLDDGNTWLQLNADSSGSTAIGGDANSNGAYSAFVDGSDNIDLAYTSATCDTSGSDRSACFRVLTFNSTDFTYSVGAEATVYAGVAAAPIDFPSVTESSNATIFVEIDAEGASGVYDATQILYSTNGTGWSAETARINDSDDPVLVMEAATNERMSFYAYTSNNYLKHNYYNGTAWVGEVAVSDIGSAYNYSVAVGSGLPGDVHLVYTNSGAVNYRSYNGTSWSNATSLASANADDAVITYLGFGRLIVFAAITEGNVERIQYKRYNGTSWDSNWTYVSGVVTAFDSVQVYSTGESNYIIETTDAGDYGEGDVSFLAYALNDYLYIGSDSKFESASFFLSTNSSTDLTPDWEYYGSNTANWADLTETDNTAGFTASGSVTWSNPADWTQNEVNGVTKYWARVSGGSSPMTPPVASYILPAQSTLSSAAPERMVEISTFEQTSQKGFGDSVNDYIFDLEVFDSYLYAVTGKPSGGAELWRTNSGLTWSQVSTDGLGDSNNVYFASLTTAGEYLYIGTRNGNTGAEMWRSTNGTGFAQVNNDGFGDSNNIAIEKTTVFKDYLFASTYNSNTGTEIWRCDVTNCDAQADWSQVNSDAFGDSINIESLVLTEVDDGTNKWLYAATGRSNTSGSEIWRCSDSSDCNTSGDWSAVIQDANGGFGDANNTIIRSAEIFNGYLYLGTNNSSTGTEVWRCDVTNCDGSADFSQINSDGFGSANTTTTLDLKSYYGQYLYAGTQNTNTGAPLFACPLSSGCNASGDWTRINAVGFGATRNQGIESFQIYKDYMYMGVDDLITGPAVIRDFYNRAPVGWTDGASSPYNVKYDEVRYRPNQDNWRWYDDQAESDPSIDFAAENTVASGVHKMNAIRLRVTLREDGHFSGTDIRMKLQYSTSNSQFFDVGPSYSTYAPWRYFDGGGSDDGTISTRRLTDSDANGPYVEELVRTSTFDQGANDWTEWDFSIENYNATANTTYYFRAVWEESNEAVILSSGKISPSLTTTTAYTLSLDTPASVTLTGYTLGAGNGISTTTFSEAEKITMRDYTGSGNGWTVTALSTNLTSGGDTLVAGSITWTTGTITPLLAASLTGVSAGAGGTMDPTTPVTVATATAGNGAGGYTIKPTIEVKDLDNKNAGNYSGTFTLTIQ